MSIEDCIIKSKEWLNELNHKQLVHAICEEVNHDLDKTVVLFESLLSHLEYCNEIEDVVFELNNQDVDGDVIALIKDM